MGMTTAFLGPNSEMEGQTLICTLKAKIPLLYSESIDSHIISRWVEKQVHPFTIKGLSAKED